MNTVVVNTNISNISRGLSLSAGQVLRLKNTVREIKVISGCAWVSYAGQDILVGAGERTAFVLNRDFPVVSALGNSPLLFDASR